MTNDETRSPDTTNGKLPKTEARWTRWLSPCLSVLAIGLAYNAGERADSARSTAGDCANAASTEGRMHDLESRVSALEEKIAALPARGSGPR